VRSRSLLSAIASVIVAISPYTVARAAPPPTSTTPRPPAGDTPDAEKVVSVIVAGSAADAAHLDKALRELLGRMGVTASLRRVDRVDEGARRAEGPAVVASVLIDVTGVDQAVVTVIDPASDAAVVRRVLKRTASHQVLLEETAHVVHGAVESVLSGRSTGADPQPDRTGQVSAAEPTSANEPPAAAVAATAPTVAEQSRPPPALNSPPAATGRPDGASVALREERAAWGIDAGALLGGHGISDSAGVVFGAGVALSAGYRHGPLRPGGWFTAEYRVPFDIDDSGASPRAQAVALRTFPTIDLLHTQLLTLQLGVGGGIDIFSIDHRFEDQQGRGKRQQTTKVAPTLTSMLVLWLRLVENVQLVTLAGIDVDLSRPSLEVRQNRSEEAKPWVVRPSLLLGASFTLGGTQPFD